MINPCSFALCGAFLLFIYLSSLIVGWVTATARAASYLEPVTVSSPPPPQRLGSLIVGWATATARGASYLEPVTVSSPPPPQER